MYMICHDYHIWIRIWSHMTLYHYILIGFLDFHCSQRIYQWKPATWTPKRCPRSSLQTCQRRRCYRSKDDGMGWCPRWIFSETMMWFFSRMTMMPVIMPVMLQFPSQSGSLLHVWYPAVGHQFFLFRGWNSLWTWQLSSGFFFHHLVQKQWEFQELGGWWYILQKSPGAMSFTNHPFRGSSLQADSSDALGSSALAGLPLGQLIP